MSLVARALFLSVFLPGLAQAQVAWDGLADIPRPGAMEPAPQHYDTIPMIDAPFPQTMQDGASPLAQPDAGIPGIVSIPYAPAGPAEAEPFFEFSNEPSVSQPAAPSRALWPGEILTPADEEPPLLGNGAIDHLLLTPAQLLDEQRAARDAAAAQNNTTAADLGTRDLGVLLSPEQAPGLMVAPPVGADVIVTPPLIVAAPSDPIESFSNDPQESLRLSLDGTVAQTNTQSAQDAAPTDINALLEQFSIDAVPTIEPAKDVEREGVFSFVENTAPAPVAEGQLIPLKPGSLVQGYANAQGGADSEWAEQSNGLPVKRVDLVQNAGDTVLILHSNEPTFWGITAPKGTEVSSVLLFGPQAPYSTVGVRTPSRVKPLTIRRPELDETSAQRLIDASKGPTITWVQR